MTLHLQRAMALLTAVAATQVAAVEPAQPKPSDLERALNRSGSDVVITQLENGATKIHLGEGFQHVTLARVNQDGKVETYCAENTELAKRFMDGEPLESLLTAHRGDHR